MEPIRGRLGAAPAPLFTQIISGLAAVIMPRLMLARRAASHDINVKAGRGDRAGRARALATFVFASAMVGWVLGDAHVARRRHRSRTRVRAPSATALFNAGLLWLTYLGLEPYVRRYAPDSLLGWTTPDRGHWRDPRVGVDVLVGVCAALAMTLLYASHNLLPPLAGYPEPMPIVRDAQFFSGLQAPVLRHRLSDLGRRASSMLAVVGIVGFMLLLRNRMAAALTAMVVFAPAVIERHVPGRHATARPCARVLASAPIFVLAILRAGLLATIAALCDPLHPAARADYGRPLELARAVRLWPVAIVLALGLGGCYLAARIARRAATTFSTCTRIGVPSKPKRLAQPVHQKALVGEVKLGRDVGEEHERRRRDARLRGVEDAHLPLARG